MRSLLHSLVRPRRARGVAPIWLSTGPFVFSSMLAAQPVLPRTHAPRPTRPAITSEDLMTRLYIFADDSMEGRATGARGHARATQYVANELRRLGIKPAGEGGTYFQHVPMLQRTVVAGGGLAVNGASFRPEVDYRVTVRRNTPSFENTALPVVYGGEQGDTVRALTAEQVRGKLVVMRRASRSFRDVMKTGPYKDQEEALKTAAAVAMVIGDSLGAPFRSLDAPNPDGFLGQAAEAGPPEALSLMLTTRVVRAIFGDGWPTLAKGIAGAAVTVRVAFRDSSLLVRNVVGVIPGGDPALRGQYVAVGAHSDHNGFLSGPPIDHDSFHVFSAARRRIANGKRVNDEQQARINAIPVNVDSLRAIRPARPDSINNGADDDGSGSVSILEIAEAFATAKVKPKRSILLVWHAAEERGLVGSRWFTDHPTVPRDSIVAQINMDMVGRGERWDRNDGGPDYLQIVGSRRLSTEFGTLVEAVNAGQPKPMQFDSTFDADGHPDNIYCRSDHYSYARFGIPVVFFTTGLHGDYHYVTDEPQYISYDHMRRVTQLAHDIAQRVANLDHRLVVDKPKPDPNGACKQ